MEKLILLVSMISKAFSFVIVRRRHSAVLSLLVSMTVRFIQIVGHTVLKKTQQMVDFHEQEAHFKE